LKTSENNLEIGMLKKENKLLAETIEKFKDNKPPEENIFGYNLRIEMKYQRIVFEKSLEHYSFLKDESLYIDKRRFWLRYLNINENLKYFLKKNFNIDRGGIISAI